MPPEADVFVVEDNKDWQEIIKYELEKKGHRVVATAARLDDALRQVPTLIEKGVSVAVLDGNLSEMSYSGGDGQRVLSEIKELAPHIKTIGMSANNFPGVDFDLGKEDVSNIGSIVTKL